jgi:hypothetical protein
MKRLLLALVVALSLIVLTVSPAVAAALELPNGDTIEGLPGQAENAYRSGMIVDPCRCVPPCIPPCDCGGDC